MGAGEAPFLREHRQAFGVEGGSEGLRDRDHLRCVGAPMLAPIEEREGEGGRLGGIEVGCEARISDGIEPLGQLGVVGDDEPASGAAEALVRSEEHTSELQSLMRISYAVFCLKKKKTNCTSQS